MTLSSKASDPEGIPLIPKASAAPDLSPAAIRQLTEAVFLPPTLIERADLLFVFGGTHPGHWETAIAAYHRGLAPLVLITGGVSPTGVKHPQWPDEAVPESHEMRRHLLDAGVPDHAILLEDRSRNTLENVLRARDLLDFSSLSSLIFIGKSHGAGRARATLLRHLPRGIRLQSLGFDAVYEGMALSRETWARSVGGRERVFGEYLRLRVYGALGDIAPTAAIDELQPFVAPYVTSLLRPPRQPLDEVLPSAQRHDGEQYPGSHR